MFRVDRSVRSLQPLGPPSPPGPSTPAEDVPALRAWNSQREPLHEMVFRPGRPADPRCRFCFEAQCLNRIADVAEYLGPDGLGQFITGSYAANDPQADMQ